jgi:hypothetical protein
MANFLPWVSKFIKQATGLITSLTALIVALYALWQAIENSHLLHQDHNTIGAIVENHNATVTTNVADSIYYVQLATYNTDACDAAVSEISGYKDAFEPKAKLFSESSGKYLVVAVEAKSLDEARSVVKKANELAKDPSQSGNDLAHALIRVNPNWQPHTC